MKTLRFFCYDELWFIMVQNKEGQIQLIKYMNIIKNDIDKWLQYGLSEYVRVENDLSGNKEPRLTESNHPEFLFRLGQYLAKTTSQVRFMYEEDIL